MRHLIPFAGFMDTFAEDGAPDADRLISGSPAFRTHNLDTRENDRLFAGRWQSTVGAWRVHYDEWEYCMIVSGRGRLTDAAGESLELAPGVSFIVQPGFTGLFEVTEELTKDYVILLPANPSASTD